MSILRNRKATFGTAPAASAIACGLALFLTGCNIFDFGPPDADIGRPATLHPEADIFASGDDRVFQISEGIIRIGRDTTFATRSLEFSRLGDTLIGGVALTRVEAGTAPAPASVLTLLGLRSTRLFFDTVNIPDPGPALRFPDTPKAGWSLDTTVGDLRHVRRMTGIENIKAAGKRHECWVFKDSTYLGTTALSTETYWMGARGLVLHRQEWPSYSPTVITGGTLWRETLVAN